VIPLYETDGRSTCPMGMPMCQNRLAVPTWSYAMEVLPPQRVIEIGSYNGAFSIALGLHCCAINARMYTFDINEWSEQFAPIGKALGVTFQRASCWDIEAQIVRLIRADGPTFVLCDGGDKPRELATFARYLKPGDVIGAHDYNACAYQDPVPPQNEQPWPWMEISREDGQRAAEANRLVPWLQEHFDLAGWLVFRKS
jgi:hypothetical protein